MGNKDHIVDPVLEFEEISHSYENNKNESFENIPKICKVLDSFVYKTTATISWLSVVLVVIILAQVLLRYIFSINLIKLDELQWHLYAVLFMFGLSFTMVNHSHVRVDILRVHLSAKTQRIIEIFGILFLMIPFISIVIDYGYDLTFESFRVAEKSDTPEGLSYRWLIKAVIPLSFVFLLIASISRVLRHISFLIKGKQNGNK